MQRIAGADSVHGVDCEYRHAAQRGAREEEKVVWPVAHREEGVGVRGDGA